MAGRQSRKEQRVSEIQPASDSEDFDREEAEMPVGTRMGVDPRPFTDMTVPLPATQPTYPLVSLPYVTAHSLERDAQQGIPCLAPSPTGIPSTREPFELQAEVNSFARIGDTSNRPIPFMRFAPDLEHLLSQPATEPERTKPESPHWLGLPPRGAPIDRLYEVPGPETSLRYKAPTMMRPPRPRVSREEACPVPPRPPSPKRARSPSPPWGRVIHLNDGEEGIASRKKPRVLGLALPDYPPGVDPKVLGAEWQVKTSSQSGSGEEEYFTPQSWSSTEMHTARSHFSGDEPDLIDLEASEIPVVMTQLESLPAAIAPPSPFTLTRSSRSSPPPVPSNAPRATPRPQPVFVPTPVVTPAPSIHTPSEQATPTTPVSPPASVTASGGSSSSRKRRAALRDTPQRRQDRTKFARQAYNLRSTPAREASRARDQDRWFA